MAGDIGGELGARELDLYNQAVTEATKSLIELLKQLSMGKGKSFNDKKADKGIKMILKHAKSGGEIKGSVIEKDENHEFEKSLREQRVPFARIKIKDREGDSSFIYLTRGFLEIPGKENINDSHKVEKAFEEALSKKAKEQDVTKPKEIVVGKKEKPFVEGALIERGVPYAFEKAEDGKYTLAVPSKFEDRASEMIKQIRDRIRQMEIDKNAEKQNRKKEKKTSKDKMVER